MAHDDKTIKPPSFALLASEGRGLLDIPALLASAPILATAPRGQPHPVVVLPGLGADDRSTIAIRGFLETLGYQVHGWGRDRNVRAPDADLSAVVLQVRKLREDSGRRVSLVGWSRGASGPGQRAHGHHTRKPVRGTGCNQCPRHLEVFHRGVVPASTSRAAEPAGETDPRPRDVNLHPCRRCGCLACLPGGGGRAAREHRGQHHPYRAWLSPARTAGDRRSPRSAAGKLDAVSTGSVNRAVVPALWREMTIRSVPTAHARAHGLHG